MDIGDENVIGELCKDLEIILRSETEMDLTSFFDG